MKNIYSFCIVNAFYSQIRFISMNISIFLKYWNSHVSWWVDPYRNSPFQLISNEMGKNNQNYSLWNYMNNIKSRWRTNKFSAIYSDKNKIKRRASSNQVMILNLPPTTIQIESSVERISRYKKKPHMSMKKKQRWNNKRRTHSIMQKRKASRKLSAHELIQHAIQCVSFTVMCL